jgi:DsbC/DsbD-like thiol-disulfide interchange protein
MKILITFIAGLFLSLSASSQILTPLKWSYSAKRTSATEATLFLKATLDKGWHVYSQQLPAGGPAGTTFTFDPSASFQLNGKVTEPTPISKFEEAFGMKVNYFEKSVVFQQKVKLKGAKTVVKGSVEYMVCSDKQCLPPETATFSIPIN